MEEYREAQRQKWLQAQQDKQSQEASSSAGSGASTASGSKPSPSGSASSSSGAVNGEGSSTWETGAPASSGTTVPQQKPVAKRLHILPVGRAADQPSASRLDMVAPELKKKRSLQETIKEGLVIRCEMLDFIVVKIDPEDSILCGETDYFTEGDPIPRLEKVHFICLWDFDSTSAPQDPKVLFSDYIRPYFQLSAEGGQEIGHIVTIGQTLKINNLDFQVVAAEPSFPPSYIGIIDTNTMVYVNVDPTPEFDKIHIIPFQDTLPHAYDFDVFNDYLKPYLTKDGNKHVTFKVNDQFTYQGVQFKVVCCEPPGPARIGRNTTIYCEGVLHPELRNLLPPEYLEQLAQLPQGLQMLLLNTDAVAGDYQDRLIEVQEMLSRRRGLSAETINRVDKFRWGEGEHHDQPGVQTQCMVCLSSFANGEEVRRLPCNHVFHAACIDEWLKRCTDCPICKSNVDRAVRNY